MNYILTYRDINSDSAMWTCPLCFRDQKTSRKLDRNLSTLRCGYCSHCFSEYDPIFRSVLSTMQKIYTGPDISTHYLGDGLSFKILVSFEKRLSSDSELFTSYIWSWICPKCSNRKERSLYIEPDTGFWYNLSMGSNIWCSICDLTLVRDVYYGMWINLNITPLRFVLEFSPSNIKRLDLLLE